MAQLKQQTGIAATRRASRRGRHTRARTPLITRREVLSTTPFTALALRSEGPLSRRQLQAVRWTLEQSIKGLTRDLAREQVDHQATKDFADRLAGKSAWQLLGWGLRRLVGRG